VAFQTDLVTHTKSGPISAHHLAWQGLSQWELPNNSSCMEQI